MGIRRKHYPRDDRWPTLSDLVGPHGWDLDERLDQIMDNVRDPFSSYCDPSSYNEEAQWLSHEACLDYVVAGISESLGFPEGLTFEEVFAAIR